MRLTRSSALSAACVAVATAAGTLVAAPAATAAEPTAPFISEIHYDNAGADVGEFVEVQVPAGHQHRRLDGRPLQRQRTARLRHRRASAAVTAPAGAPAVAVIDYPATRHPERLAGRARPGPAGGTVVGVPVLRGHVHRRRAARQPGMTSTDIGVAEAGTERGRPVAVPRATTPPETTSGSRRRRTPRARSTRRSTPGRRRSSRARRPRPTRSARSRAAAPPPRSPASRSRVRGVVVGDVPGLAGFYLQDADGDGDAATSDGIFVFSPVPVDLGDTVAVTAASARSSAADADHLAAGRRGLRRRHRGGPARGRAAGPAGRRRRPRAPRGHARRAGRHASPSARSSTSPASAS